VLLQLLQLPAVLLPPLLLLLLLLPPPAAMSAAGTVVVMVCPSCFQVWICDWSDDAFGRTMLLTHLNCLLQGIGFECACSPALCCAGPCTGGDKVTVD
jgi:hypothetical protein